MGTQTITKAIQRQTWSYEAMSGAFSGAVVGAITAGRMGGVRKGLAGL